MAVVSSVEMNFETCPDIEMVRFFQWLYNGSTGTAVIATFDRSKPNDAPVHKFFEWPRQQSALFNYIESQRIKPWTEVWQCPLLRNSKGTRTEGDATSYGVVWADVDHTTGSALMDNLKARGFKVINTGTPGHVQVYIKLTKKVSANKHRAIQVALRELLGGDDKIADNDLLKVPASWNYKNHPLTKPDKRNVKAYQVYTSFNGQLRVDTDDFVSWLELLVNREITDVVSKGRRSSTEGISQKDCPWPERKMRSDALKTIFNHTSGDRSVDTAYLVNSLYERNFTLNEIIGVALRHEPTVDKRDGDFNLIAQDIERLYSKIKTGLPDEDTFWSKRFMLMHIYQSACAEWGTPTGVLGCQLARIIAATPPNIRLPYGGTLNLLVALVGKSSAGKGKSMKIAKKYLDVGYIKTAPLGSGEGISHLFGRRMKDGTIDFHTTSVLMNAPEVDTLTALRDRGGSTIGTQLRQAWDGADLGFSNADSAKTIPVSEGSYRFALVLGVQPEQAGPLLGDAGGGTPQRFLWVPATTQEDLPDMSAPEPLKWTCPDVVAGHDVMTICKEVSDAIVESFKRSRKEEGDHTTYNRVKVAAGFALMDMSMEINEEDWWLAGQFMAMSADTEKKMRQVLDDAVKRGDISEGKRQGRRAAAAEQVKDQSDVRRVAFMVMRRVDKGGGVGDEWVSWGALSRAMGKASNRDWLQPAIDMLIGEGKLIGKKRAVRGKAAMFYKRSRGRSEGDG